MARKLSREEQRKIALLTLGRLELVLATRHARMPRGSKDWDEMHDKLFKIRHVAFLLSDEAEAP